MTALSLFGLLAASVAAIFVARGLLVAYAKRNPYFHLADYMERFWVVRHNEHKTNRAARIHNVKRSDHDRALHDHPWNNCSVMLRGGYWEVSPGTFQQALEDCRLEADTELGPLQRAIAERSGRQVSRETRKTLARHGVHWRGAGAIVRRQASTLHRLVLPKGTDAWSLFLMGPKIKEWGFCTPDGWVHHVEYLRALGREA
jgi:hypothetical protein